MNVQYYTRRRLYCEIILYCTSNQTQRSKIIVKTAKSCVFGFYLTVASFAKGPTFTRTNPRLSPSSNLSWLFNHNSIENKSGQIPGIQFSMFLT